MRISVSSRLHLPPCVPLSILDRSKELGISSLQGISPLIGPWNPSYTSITGAWDKNREGRLKGVGDVLIVCFGKSCSLSILSALSLLESYLQQL